MLLYIYEEFFLSSQYLIMLGYNFSSELMLEIILKIAENRFSA